MASISIISNSAVSCVVKAASATNIFSGRLVAVFISTEYSSIFLLFSPITRSTNHSIIIVSSSADIIIIYSIFVFGLYNVAIIYPGIKDAASIPNARPSLPFSTMFAKYSVMGIVQFIINNPQSAVYIPSVCVV